MGDCGAHDPACAPRWAQTIGQRARGAERDFLHPMDRVSVEGVAQRPAAEEHGARLSGTVELARWSASTTRSTWRCESRRDVKQVRRWRSSTRRPPRVLKKGVLARSFRLRRGQEIKGRKRHILVDTLGL